MARYRTPPASALLLLLAIICSCAGEDSLPAPDQPALVTEDTTENELLTIDELSKESELERLEYLRALGYVSWDPGADTSLQSVTVNDPDAWPGYNIFTDDFQAAYLMDMNGNIVHEWNLGKQTWAHEPPVKKCEHAEFLPDGSILVVCVGHSLTRFDWEGNQLWRVHAPVHHDVALLPDKGSIVPTRSEVEFQGRKVFFDSLVFVSPQGQIESEWSTHENLEQLRLYHDAARLDKKSHATSEENRKYDYYHLNAVESLPATPLGASDGRFRAGNLLISLRNVNLLMILDQDDLFVVWSWGGDVLELQHTPTMLPTGNILVFDNGTYRGSSRVLEVDPTSGGIVWSYESDPPERFFSKWRGSAQRLPNGNTLICESERGHIFEITPEQRIVWEYWNPVFRSGTRQRIYRFNRLAPSLVEPLLRPDKGKS